uniref:Axin-1 n=1 Tax=Sphaeramia orbicularis TaxID=375764 RepID=A0A672YYM2_9TELE
MSISDKRGYLVDLGGSFTEDAPRPPVPGEEGELVCSDGRQQNNLSLKSEASVATPRRPDLDLGYEPEGSASPTPPYLKWAESLHSLLDDQDGILLFRMFLKQEECADMLDFWFACSGFRKLEANEGYEEKKVKLAKAIYKKYILDNNGIVSRQIKPATKSFIKDCVLKLHIDPAMFDQAQTEIQTMMEENTYPLFLKSDIYLEYTRTGGESPKPYSDHGSGSGNGEGLSGYLPTLNEDEEWRCDQEPEEPPESDPTPSNRLTQKHAPCREPINPYYVNTGYALAPAASANGSEQQSMSSDTDTLSLTDSSVYVFSRQEHLFPSYINPLTFDFISVKQLNFRSSPQRTNRIPKDIHVEPERFAAELISRLEGVLREREAQEKLEERLKRVRLKLPSRSSRFPLLKPGDAHEENPESILDDHVQRVMKTPGCQSPGTGRHSPKSRSPDGFPAGKGFGLGLSSGQSKHPPRHSLKGEPSHLYHHKHVHHIHHTGVGKPKEQVEAEAATRVHGGLHWGMETSHYGSKSRYADGMGSSPMDAKGGAQCKRAFKKGEEGRPYDMPGPAEEMEKNQKILLSTTGSKKTTGHEGSRLSSAERSASVHTCVGAQMRNAVQPSHPFIQDPTMPPNPAPSPLIQLEEVCRRLEEENIKTQQHMTRTERDSNHQPFSYWMTPTKKQPCEKMTVAYYFCGEPIPYTTSIDKGRVVTLGQFKELLTKKGNYRYYFKKVSDEFDCGVVFEEVREDDAILPIFEEKIIGKVEKIYSSAC